MANGEKTVPGPMEDIMLGSPLIMGAIIFGRQRNQVGVLIEPKTQYKVDPTDEQQVETFRNLIWSERITPAGMEHLSLVQACRARGK
jgi:long-subunit acyl-CoA synthetase (AMP-forming)